MQHDQLQILGTLKNIVSSHIHLVEDAKVSNEQNYLNSKLWIKQAFNNLFSVLPKELLEQDVTLLLTHIEQDELLKNPQSAIDYFKSRFQREIDEHDWEDEPIAHQTPPKRVQHIIQPRLAQSNNTGFRKKPATIMQSSNKKAISHVPKQRFNKKY